MNHWGEFTNNLRGELIDNVKHEIMLVLSLSPVERNSLIKNGNESMIVQYLQSQGIIKRNDVYEFLNKIYSNPKLVNIFNLTMDYQNNCGYIQRKFIPKYLTWSEFLKELSGMMTDIVIESLMALLDNVSMFDRSSITRFRLMELLETDGFIKKDDISVLYNKALTKPNLASVCVLLKQYQASIIRYQSMPSQSMPSQSMSSQSWPSNF